MTRAVAHAIRPDPTAIPAPPSPARGDSIATITPRVAEPPEITSDPVIGRDCQLIENLIERGRRDAEVFALRRAEASACVGEHGEFTLEVCRGSIAHGLIMPAPRAVSKTDCQGRIHHHDPIPDKPTVTAIDTSSLRT